MAFNNIIHFLVFIYELYTLFTYVYKYLNEYTCHYIF